MPLSPLATLGVFAAWLLCSTLAGVIFGFMDGSGQTKRYILGFLALGLPFALAQVLPWWLAAPVVALLAVIAAVWWRKRRR